MLEEEFKQDYNYNIDDCSKTMKENKDLTEKEKRRCIKLNSLKTKDEKGLKEAYSKGEYKKAFKII